MERVAFLIEDTHVRLGCLLNPEALVQRRVAGIRPRQSTSGLVTGVGLRDDPLLYTGGGRTELDLDLLFDVSLAGSSITTNDVRDLTGAFWDLAENARQGGLGYGAPPLVRFIWGKIWNIPGHIVAVAERLEYFTADGIPRRSWLRLRMVRSNERVTNLPGSGRRTGLVSPQGVLTLGDIALPEGSLRVHQISGGAAGFELGLSIAAPSLGGALLTAADIIGSSLANTNAARLLAAARKGIAGAVQSLGARIGALFAGESRVGLAVRAALGRISSALAGAWSAAKEATVRAFSTAAAAVSAAAQRVWGAVRAAVAPLGAAIAAEFQGPLQAIRRGVGIMGQAVAAVARSARATAARVAAVVARGVDAAVSRVRSILDSAAAVTSDLGQSLRAALGPALDDIGQVLSAARQAGAVVTTAMARAISTRLQQVAAGAESLWSAGRASLARGLDATVKAIAQALHRMAAAREALAAVHVRESTGVVQASIQRTRDHLAQLQGAPDEEQIAVLREDLAEVRASTDVVSLVTEPPAPGEEAPQPAWGDAAQVLDAAAEQLDTPEAAQAAEAILAPLDRIAEALPVVEQEHEAVQADALAGAYAQADTEISEASFIDSAAGAEILLAARSAGPLPASRTVSGQRLDQLAYEYYGDAAYWRLLALYNDVDHPLRLPTGMVLQVPPTSVVRRASDAATDGGRSPGGG